MAAEQVKEIRKEQHMSVFGVRTFADVRALFYVLTPLVVAWLVQLGVVGDREADLWVALGVAVLSPALAFAHTVDGFRRWFYPAVAAVSGLLLGYGIVTDSQLSPVLAIVSALVGAGVAAANTPTS
jgi:hypothetical protein